MALCKIIIRTPNGGHIEFQSNLVSNLVSIESIAQQLVDKQENKEALKDLIVTSKFEKLAEKDYKENGVIVATDVFSDLEGVNRLFLDMDEIDPSYMNTPIILTNNYQILDKNYSDCILEQGGQKVFIIKPSMNNYKALYKHLVRLSKLKQSSDELDTLKDALNFDDIKAKLEEHKKSLKKKYDRYIELEKKGEDNRTKQENKEFRSLLGSKQIYEMFQVKTPKTVDEFIIDVLENQTTKYSQFTYSKDGYKYTTNDLIKDILEVLDGHSSYKLNSPDSFTNYFYDRIKYDYAKSIKNDKVIYSISKANMNVVLYNKIDILKRKIQDGDANQNIQKLLKQLEEFYKKAKHDNKDWEELINVLIASTDSEFSYKFYAQDKEKIFFTNVIRTVEEKYPDINWNTITLLEPMLDKNNNIEEYKGYRIYKRKIDNGDDYFFSLHPITTSSYAGKRYSSLEECKKAIDYTVRNSDIYKLSGIGFHLSKKKYDTMHDHVHFVPNKYNKGQVVKVLSYMEGENDLLQFEMWQKISQYEYEFIFTHDEELLKYTNIQDDFFKKFQTHILDWVKSYDKSKARKLLEKVDTFEKISCFMMLLNQDTIGENNLKSRGENVGPITLDVIQNIVNILDNAKYKYYVVEDQDEYFTIESPGANKFAKRIKKAYGKEYDKKNVKCARTLLTPIKYEQINKRDEKYGKLDRHGESIQYLRALGDKIQAKLNPNNDENGLHVYVMTQSELEQELGEKMDIRNGVKAFIYNGNIYVNASCATIDDMFHEYTHIMLGVLKVVNFENYQKLMQIVGTKLRRQKEKLRKVYPDLADTDLDEELFANQFGKWLSSQNKPEELNDIFMMAKQQVGKALTSIFSKDTIDTGAFEGVKNVFDIFQQFGYDLNKYMKSGNDMNLEKGRNFRQATNWIQQQIKKYKDDQSIGIEEICS